MPEIESNHMPDGETSLNLTPAQIHELLETQELQQQEAEPTETEISKREFEEIILTHLQEGYEELNGLQAQSAQLEGYIASIESVQQIAQSAEDLGMIVRYYLDENGNISARYSKRGPMGFYQSDQD